MGETPDRRHETHVVEHRASGSGMLVSGGECCRRNHASVALWAQGQHPPCARGIWSPRIRRAETVCLFQSRLACARTRDRATRARARMTRARFEQPRKTGSA
eukprot:10583057-Alexandrium_andersonii.AAC.1